MMIDNIKSVNNNDSDDESVNSDDSYDDSCDDSDVDWVSDDR